MFVEFNLTQNSHKMQRMFANTNANQDLLFRMQSKFDAFSQLINKLLAAKKLAPTLIFYPWHVMVNCSLYMGRRSLARKLQLMEIKQQTNGRRRSIEAAKLSIEWAKWNAKHNCCEFHFADRECMRWAQLPRKPHQLIDQISWPECRHTVPVHAVHYNMFMFNISLLQYKNDCYSPLLPPKILLNIRV